MGSKAAAGQDALQLCCGSVGFGAGAPYRGAVWPLRLWGCHWVRHQCLRSVGTGGQGDMPMCAPMTAMAYASEALAVGFGTRTHRCNSPGTAERRHGACLSRRTDVQEVGKPA